MTDLIERLRDRYSKHTQELRDEAADEIERLTAERIAPDHVYERNRELLLEVDHLRAALEKIARREVPDATASGQALVAREALKRDIGQEILDSIKELKG